VDAGDGIKLERRVVPAAEAALAKRQFVTAIDVLVGLGWLKPRRLDEWRQGRVDYLERMVVASPAKNSTAMRCFDRWAQARGLKPSETGYVARTRGREPLRFSQSGDPGIERTYRTHWMSPELSERKRARLAERQSRPPDLVVVSPVKDWTCSLCGTEDAGWLIMEDSGPVCMTCADMGHLVFLPSGDAALTRRAKAGSRMSAVVVRFSRSRLSSALDDIVDYIEEVADYLTLYRIEAPMVQAQALAHVLVDATRQIDWAIPLMRGFKSISKYTIEVHRLENEGDRIVRGAIASLFEGGIDPMVVIRWKDIFEMLENAIDATGARRSSSRES
jgi:Protein of unknown function DUF47